MNAEAAALAHVGQIIADKYRLLGLLGAGGMGAVYEAEHVFTKRRVALKRMHQSSAKSKLAAERFLRESQAPSSIGHPGIVQVLDAGSESDGSLYLVLELLEGVSMREALDEDALQPEAVVRIGIELLEALASAHDKGFVHRDIKPDNIFLADDGRGGVTVKLLDFGVASMRDTEADPRLTQTGAVLGTPLYMSPEQATGERVDARSDLWSVGALLYRALAGAAPFEGDSYNALIVSIVTRDHVPLSDRSGALPDALLQVVERALQKQAHDRFPSAREMLEALQRVRFDAQPQSRLHLRAPAALPPRRGLPRWIPWALAAGVLVPASLAMLRVEPRNPPKSLAAAADPRAVEPLPLRSGSTARTLDRASTAAATEPEPDFEPAYQPPLAAGGSARKPTSIGPATPQPMAAVGLSVEQISGVLATLQPQMQACLQDEVVAQPQSGALTARRLLLSIELHIAPDGRAEAVRTAGAVPPELERCVRARLAEAVFPAASVATEFRYPLIFESTIIGK